MSPNDRRDGKFSKEASSGYSGRKRRDATSSKWKKKNEGKSKNRDSNKSSSYSENSFQENYDRRIESKAGFKSRSNSINYRKNTSNSKYSKEEWSNSNQGTSSIRYPYGKHQNRVEDKRTISSDFINNQIMNSKRDDIRHENQGRIFHENEANDIFWGRHSTQSILESGRPIHRIWCTSEIRSSPRFLQLIKDAKSLGVLVEEVSWARLGHVTKGGVHQGIAIQTAAAETFDLKTLVDGCRSIGEEPVLIALDGLTDPHNLGAIVRSAEALGAHGIVLPQRRSAGLTGSVAKVAAGALEHLPVARVINLNRSLEELKKSGYTVVGLSGEGDKTINEFSFEGPIVLVIGSEGKGLSLLTRRHCDVLLRIPLRGVTSSLNASVATSIFLYEIASQGWMKDLSGQAPSPKLARAKLITKPLDGIQNSSS